MIILLEARSNIIDLALLFLEFSVSNKKNWYLGLFLLDNLHHDDLNFPAFTLGERFVRDIAQQLSRKLFLLFGDMGTGKTMLIHAMANLFMDLKAQDPKLVQERTNTQMPLCLIATLDDLKRSWFYVSDESFGDCIDG